MVKGSKIKTSKVILPVFIGLLFLFTASCSSRINKIGTKDLIPEKELVSILSDLYLADGLLGLQSINRSFNDLDSMAAYIQVIERHGFTKDEMDRTMKYYYVRKPKDLIKIYDQVLGNLTAIESKTDLEVVKEMARTNNLWPKLTNSFYPDYSEPDSSTFTILQERAGFYTFSYTAAIYPDDQSNVPCFSLYTCNADSADTGKRTYFTSIAYLKDGQPHQYHIIINIPKSYRFIMQGSLYSCRNGGGNWIRNARFEDIVLSFSPFVQ